MSTTMEVHIFSRQITQTRLFYTHMITEIRWNSQKRQKVSVIHRTR